MRERLKGTGGSVWAVHRQGSLRPKPFDERPYPLTPSSRSPPSAPPLPSAPRLYRHLQLGQHPLSFLPPGVGGGERPSEDSSTHTPSSHPLVSGPTAHIKRQESVTQSSMIAPHTLFSTQSVAQARCLGEPQDAFAVAGAWWQKRFKKVVQDNCSRQLSAFCPHFVRLASA